jgi:hypothetical protein
MVTNSANIKNNKGFKKGVKQGIYTPVNPHKWIITESFDSKGTPGIKYRSSWELKFMVFCDMNDLILKVNSEGIVIPYLSPIDNKMHRYYMDFIVETKNKVSLVEVKPYAQTQPPKKPKRNTKKSEANYQKAVQTFIVNQAKWEATKNMCLKNNWDFKIITEKELGV